MISHGVGSERDSDEARRDGSAMDTDIAGEAGSGSLGEINPFKFVLELRRRSGVLDRTSRLGGHCIGERKSTRLHWGQGRGCVVSASQGKRRSNQRIFSLTSFIAALISSNGQSCPRSPTSLHTGQRVGFSLNWAQAPLETECPHLSFARSATGSFATEQVKNPSNSEISLRIASRLFSR